MKKLFTLTALIAAISIFAQAPQGFNYQATVRNSSGTLIINQNVNFKFNIMLNSTTSVPIFSEIHMAPTDNIGQVSLVIGQGTATTGIFSTINWGTGSYYLGIELNTGNGYVAMGTTQLLSVPYALYANSAGNSQATIPNLGSVLAVNNSANSSKIINLQNPSDAQDAATKGYTDLAINQLQNQIANLQVQILALQIAPIGTQIWQNINLDVTTYRDGTPIPEVTDPTAWAALTTGAWCYYNNDQANGAIYGKLYNLYAVMGVHDNDPNTPNKILAPVGSHVASYAEWNTLVNFLGGTGVTGAGGKMKSTGTTLWLSPNGNATNSSGFKALPGGRRISNGVFNTIGSSGQWWTSSADASLISSWEFNLFYLNGGISNSYGSINNCAFSVRCIRD